MNKNKCNNLKFKACFLNISLYGVVLIIALFIAFNSLGQAYRMYNPDSICATVEIPSIQNLYYGITNYVEIKVPGIKNDEIEVSVSNGTVRKYMDDEYSITVNDRSYCTVFVSHQGKKLVSREFVVKRIPDPSAVIGGKWGGLVTKDWLAAQTGIAAKFKDFNLDIRFNVISFKISCLNRSREMVELKSNSARFTAAQQNLIRSVRSKRKVYIYDIKAKGPDEEIRELNSIVFSIR